MEEAAANTSISFTKQLLKSHVTNIFHFRLPKDFCETHLPCHNDTIVLVENQSETEFSVGYDAKKNRVVRGWRYFVRENGLLEGDTLVFELIQPCKFKVYINRTGTGESHQPTGAGHDYPVLKPCRGESLPANSKKRSPETYPVSPKGKVRPGMDNEVKLQCGNILRKLMNHSYGCIFNQPVDPVKLQIPDYFSVIRKPMDLGTIKHKLVGNRYSNMEEFAADVRLTFSNAMCYNLPEHEVHKWAKLFNDRFNKKWELLESKLKQQEPTTEDDDGQDSRQSVRTSCHDNAKEWEYVVHAGADKLAGWKKRKMNSMVKLQCGNILRELMSQSSSWTFNEPVDPVKLNFPDYVSVIKEPMDLGTIEYKLDRNRYSNREEFAADVRLTFSNATLYNPPDHEAYKWAEFLNDHFSNKLDLLESKLKCQGPTTAGDDGQDSQQSVRKSCDGNRTDCTIFAHAGAGKVRPVKIVEDRSKFAVNNVQTAKCPLCGFLICCCCENDTPDQTFLSDLSSEPDRCSDSKMDKLCQVRKRVHEEMIPEKKENHVIIQGTHKSTETSGADVNLTPNIHDIPNDAENTGIVKKEIHAMLDVRQCRNSVRVALSNQFDSLSKNVSESVLNFTDLKGFKDFKIHWNGENLDSVIPFQIQRKYYELCHTQKEFLHAHLTKGLNSTVVAEMIKEIISIADATRAATISTSFDQLEQMCKTLKFFEGCGMKAGFLRVRLLSLVKLSHEHLTATKLKRAMLSVVEDEKTTMREEMSKMDKLMLSVVEDEKTTVRDEISKTDKLMESVLAHGTYIRSLEAEIGVLEEKTEELDKTFRRVADSPWW